MTYELWYWPGISGRGEFVRLALEAGGIAYREMNADHEVAGDIRERRPEPFAHPYLVVDGMVIAQVANILLFLGDRHGLAPPDDAGRHLAHGIQLTIADMVAETHDTHHPVAMMDAYEDQKSEAARRAADFRAKRMPKYLGWFERLLERSDGDWLTGTRWTYADLSLFQLVDGLRFAFPTRMEALAADHARVMGLHARVRDLPALAAYLASDRRLPFGEGIFRHYPELDGAD